MNTTQSIRNTTVLKVIALIAFVLFGLTLYALEAKAATCADKKCSYTTPSWTEAEKIKYNSYYSSNIKDYSTSYKAKNYNSYNYNNDYKYSSYSNDYKSKSYSTGNSYNNYIYQTDPGYSYSSSRYSYPTYSYGTYYSSPSYYGSYSSYDRGYPNSSYQNYQYYSNPYYSSSYGYGNSYGSYSGRYSDSGSRGCLYGYNRYGLCAESWGDSTSRYPQETQRGVITISVDSPISVRICDVQAYPQPICGTQTLTLTRLSYTRQTDIRFQVKDSNGQWTQLDNTESFSIPSTGPNEQYKYGVYPTGTWWELHWL